MDESLRRGLAFRNDRRLAMKLPVLFLMMFVLPVPGVRAETNVERALEDFAMTGSGFGTSGTTDESTGSDLHYFEFDVDGDGNKDIFVSRPDLSSHGEDAWMLYQAVGAQDAGVRKIGMATVRIASMKPGTWNGKAGYYHAYHLYQDNRSRVIFTTIGDDGTVVTPFKETLDFQGKDKALYDRIYSGESAEPEVRTAPVAPLRTRAFLKKKASGAAEGRPRKGDVREPSTGGKDRESGSRPRPGNESPHVRGGTGMWVMIPLGLLGLWLFRRLCKVILGGGSS